MITPEYELLTSIKEGVALFLPNPMVLTDEQARRILRRYTAAIQGNFVNWMAAAAVSARSVEGRFAAEENIFVEMRDDHPGMLESFAKSAGAVPEREDFDFVNPEVVEIRKVVSEMSGIKLITLMGVLETTSAAFIPLLETLAKKCGGSNTKYTAIHGEADKEHAEQFCWALTHERKHYVSPDADINQTVQVTIQLLEKIFK